MKTESFGVMLKRLRTEAKYTLRDLGDQARIPYSDISAIEAGRRSISCELAERLIEVLQVKDKDMFLLKAISTTKRQKLLPVVKLYDAWVLNSMALYLANTGIKPSEITETYFEDPTFVSGSMHKMKQEQWMQLNQEGQVGPCFVVVKGDQKFTVTVNISRRNAE